MPRFSFILLLLGVCSCAAFAQPKQQADSLQLVSLSEHLQRQLSARQYDSASWYASRLCELALPYAQQQQDSISWDGYLKSRESWSKIQVYQSHFQPVLDQLPGDIAAAKPVLGPNHLRIGDLLHQLGTAYWKLERYAISQDYLQQALTVIENQSSLDSSRVSRSYNSIGYVYSRLGQQELALSYHEKTLAIRRAMYGETHELIAQSYNNMGNMYRSQGQLQEALRLQQLALTIRRETLGDTNPKVGASYNNLGNIYYEQGDHALAAEQYERAKAVWKAAFGEEHLYLVGIGSNLAAVYLDLGKDQEARQTNQAAMETGQRLLPPTHPVMGNLHRQFSILFRREKAYEQAEAELALAIDIKTESLGAGHWEVAQLHQELGSLYLEEGKTKAAIAAFQYALDRQVQSLGTSHPTVALSRSSLGEAWLTQGDCEQAQQWHRLSVEGMQSAQAPFSPYRLAASVLTYAKGISQCDTSLSALQQADSLLQSWSELVTQARRGYQREASQLRQRAADREGYEAAIGLSLQLYERTRNPAYLAQSFAYAEQSKAALLTEALQEADARALAQLPTEILNQEKQLLERLQHLERQQFEAIESQSLDSVELLALQREQFQTRENYDDFLQQLARDYPGYYQLKYEPSQIGLHEIQAQLSTGTALLEYFWGQEQLFVWLVEEKNIQFWQIPAPKELAAQIQSFRQAIYGPYLRVHREVSANDPAFPALAHDLYRGLLAPFAVHIPERLIVIPDGQLGYLPFEALLTEPGQDDSYLGKKKVISYAFSAALLAEMKQRPSSRFARSGVLAIAPDFSPTLPAPKETESYRGEYLGPLLYNQPEAEAVQAQMGGRSLLGDAAGRDQFVKLAPYYRLLHLATHAKVNESQGDFSYLAFAKSAETNQTEVLYLSDLYQLELKADLVVLSACETGIGELLEGEGIASMARGFSYAGAKSIVTSLWSVNDQATMLFMQRFYEALAAGEDKARALHLAKLELMEKKEFSAPFFWASFVLIGDEAPLTQSPSSPAWWALGFLLLLWVGGGIWWRKKA